MLAKSFYTIRNNLHDFGVIFAYSGYVTEPILTGLAEALKIKLLIDAADKTTMRNVFGIFVEQMQNIIRYSAETTTPDHRPDTELRYGVMAIGNEKGKYFVICGNKIKQEDVARLREKLTEIRRLDKDGLKTLYQEKMKEPTDPNSKGAGLGFIDIARRSSRVIDFDFLEIDDQHAFFCLKACV